MRKAQISFAKYLSMVAITAIFSTSARAEGNGIGAGITYAAPTQAMVVNPAVLTDSTLLEAEAMWRFVKDAPYAALTGGVVGIGLGADYRKELGQNIFEAGVGVKAAMFGLGATMQSVGGDYVDFDTALNIDLVMIRLSAVARGWHDGLDRLDLGLGFKVGPASFSADFKKSYPFSDDEKVFFLDFSTAIDVGEASLGVGYDVMHSKSGGWSDGHLHAGVSVQVIPKLYVQGFYRPLAREWITDDWALGARYTF